MSDFETQARAETYCRACGRPKKLGLIVCWECFKGRTPSTGTGFKYYAGNLEDWLETLDLDECTA